MTNFTWFPYLPVRRPVENHPVIERNAALFASSASLRPEIRSSTLYHIAKPDLLVGYKPRQADLMRQAFASAGLVSVFDLPLHAVRLRTFAIDKVR
jgi:hypothetical protein